MKTNASHLTIAMLLLSCAPFLFAPHCLAQESPENKAEAVQAEPVPLKLFNRLITILRANVYGYSPAARVKLIEERFEEQLDKGGKNEISSETVPEGVMFYMDGVFLFAIVKGDISPYETMSQATNKALVQLESALKKIKEQKDLKHNLEAVALVLLGLVVFLFFLWLLVKIHNALRAKMEKLENRLQETLRKHALLPLGYHFFVLSLITRLLFWTMVGLCVYGFLTFSFLQFPYTEPWGQMLGTYIGDMISNLMLSGFDSIPNLFIIMIILVVTQWLGQILRKFFKDVEHGHLTVSWLDSNVARPTARITVGVLWMLALVMAYPYIPGGNSGAFKGIGVFIGLLVSLGASGIVGQVISGMVLMYSRSIKIGEIVQVGENFGRVVELGFFSTKLMTPKHEEINIPNVVLVSTVTKNYSRLFQAEGIILSSTVTIGYDTPWRQVHALLRLAANMTPGLAKTPEPFVLQKALSDYYVEYELNAYLETPDHRIFVLSALHANIQDQFNEFGVQIMSPSFESQPEGKVYVPKEKWHEPPAETASAPPPGA